MVESFGVTQEHESIGGNIDIFNVRWNNKGTQWALGTTNGYMHLYSSSNELIREYNCQSGAEKMPITSIRFRPQLLDTQKKPIALVTTCDGGVLHCNILNGKSSNITRLRNEQIYSSDYNFEGSKYVLGCKDGVIKIFDEENLTQITSFTEHAENGAQRVFCVKWFDENLILSAGWNNKITIWDTRTNFQCREMLGPHICGESVSIRNNYVVSGSYDIHNQLQVWALDSGRNIFTTSLNFNGKKCMPYAVEFCKSEGTVFVVGGTGTSDLYFYDAATLNQVATIGNINKIVYSIHSSTNKLAVAVGNTVKIYSI